MPTECPRIAPAFGVVGRSGRMEKADKSARRCGGTAGGSAGIAEHPAEMSELIVQRTKISENDADMHDKH